LKRTPPSGNQARRQQAKSQGSLPPTAASKVMLTLTLAARNRNLSTVRRRLGLSPGEVDEHFGVVVIDPSKDLCTVLVDEAAAARVMGKPGVQGRFSNPRIEPLGPPQ
jgi:hypothetical protein